MKKILIVILSIIMILGLSSCDTSQGADGNPVFIEVHDYLRNDTCYINTNNIVAIHANEHYNDGLGDVNPQYRHIIIYTTDGKTFKIKETPEEVLKMIEKSK